MRFRLANEGNGLRRTARGTHSASNAALRFDSVDAVVFLNGAHRASLIGADSAGFAGVLVDQCDEIALGHQIGRLKIIEPVKDSTAAGTTIANKVVIRFHVVRVVDEAFFSQSSRGF